jgi:glyoxylase-like metal-dependent hydrolase (beta-lactamase superfamily II)/uncharacterized protein with ACT and thioredoxin-like domain
MKDKNKELMHSIAGLPVKVYRSLGSSSKEGYPELVIKFRIFLEDKPGSLADFASFIADTKGNISFFHYDRSVHSSRVIVEIQMVNEGALGDLLNSLTAGCYSFEETLGMKDDVQITSIENILKIKVRLRNEPGTLAGFANILKAHDANVIYMFYDEDIDPESAEIAMATKDILEINKLMDAVNKESYPYRVLYRGTEEKEVEHIIGLKLVEKFFLKLRKLLPGKEFDEIRSIVDSSQELSADLVHFYEEAGNYLESGDVFEKILTLASKARTWVGERFSVVEMPVVQVNEQIRLYSFRLPTTENIYLFHYADELVMIDAGYGVYYEDLKKLLRERSLDPSKVRRIFLTHPDADHAGTAGYFAREFGAEVYMHPACKGVIENNNRAYGASGRLSELNKYYTRLINKFTDCKFPEDIHFFSTTPIGNEGEFNIIDVFTIGNLTFEVLESHGGHIPGHVFFLNKDSGLVFTSDFLINIRSLSAEEKDILSVYRYLLTNPNSDNQLFKSESDALRDVIMNVENDLKSLGSYATIFPGHGDYYRANSIIEVLTQKRQSN